jgi:multidrug resistance efflux pump
MHSSSGIDRRPEPEIDADARVRWLEERIAALERHVEYQIERLEEAAAEARRYEEQARRYEELMQTKTMRVLRRPRAAYAWLRRLRRRRHA